MAAAQLFMWLVAFVIVGFLWFWIVRLILEDWGVIGPYVPPRYDAETKRIVNTLPAAEPLPRMICQLRRRGTNADGAGRRDGRTRLCRKSVDGPFEVDRTKTRRLS